VAFYVEDGDKDANNAKSIIKFGGMDKVGLQDDSKQPEGTKKLRIFRTKYKSSWDLSLLSLKVAGQEIASDFTLAIEPQLPFIYLPPAIFSMFVQNVNEKTKGLYKDPVCSLENNACKFPVTCDKVTSEVYMSFKIDDSTGQSYTFSLSAKNMRIPDDDIGLKGDDCYIPVFNHNYAREGETIILGNIIMKKFYVVYDMSPLESGNNYIQIAFGPKNPNNNIRA